MATPWWAKIGPGYYGRPKDDDDPETPEPEPSAIVQATSGRAREMAAAIASVRLREQPEVVGAMLNSGVPISVVQRADIEYRRAKALKEVEVNNQQKTQDAITAEQARIEQAEQDSGTSFWDAWLYASTGVRQAKPGEPNSYTPPVAAEKGMAALNAAFSFVTVPFSAGRANQRAGWSEDQLNEFYDLRERARGGDTAAVREMITRFKTGPVNDYALPPEAKAQDPIGLGLSIIYGGGTLTPQQADDMRRAGYDPDSFASRYAWYFDALEPGQRAFADQDIDYFNQRFNPKDVQNVREIITSNYFNDGVLGGLSPNAQDFVLRASSGDAEANDLLDRMNHSATVHIGSTIPDLLGLERGTTEATFASVAGDIAIYWALDPVAIGGRAASLVRTRARGVAAGDMEAALDKIVAVRRLNDPDSVPQYKVGRDWDEMFRSINQVYLLHGNAGKVGDETVAAAMHAEASRLAEQFRLRHPDMSDTWEVMMAARSGNLQNMRLGSQTESAARAEKTGVADVYFMDRVEPRGGQGGRHRAQQGGGPPLWQLEAGPDGLATQRSLNQARADMTERMGDWIFADAVAHARPLQRGLILMPGEVAINRRARSMLMPLRDAIFGIDRTLYSQVVGSGRTPGLVRFDGTFPRVDEQFIGRAHGEWTRASYSQKRTRAIERALARLELSPSGKYAEPGDMVGSAEAYRRLVLQYYGRRAAYIMTNKWSMSSPAEQAAQWRQTWEGIFAAAGLRNTKEARDFQAEMTKGIMPGINQPNRMGRNEIYTVDEANNTIRANDMDIAAGLYPYQMRQGWRVPNLRAMRQMEERRSLLEVLTGRGTMTGLMHFFNSKAASTPTKLWKVGKVGNPANMARQAVELYYLQIAEQGLAHGLRILRARREVAGMTVRDRLVRNDHARAANLLDEAALDSEVNAMNLAHRSGDNVAYGDALVAAGRRAGFKERELQSLREIGNEGVWYEYVRALNGMNPARLEVARLYDAVRRIRLRLFENRGPLKPEVVDTPHQRWADAVFMRAMLAPHIEELEGSAAGALLLTDRVYGDVAEGVSRGFGGTVNRTPNARELMGVAGDSGARRWFREFDSRQNDIMPSFILRALAIEARSPLANPARILNDEALDLGGRALFPPGVNTAEEMARYLIGQSPMGAHLREQAMRLHFTESGSQVAGTADETEAVRRLAEAWVRDLGAHMGLRPTGGAVPTELEPLLDTIAAGGQATLADLSRIPDDLRPQAVSASLYVPKIPRGMTRTEGLVNGAAKLYGWTVARPLARLAIHPSFIANKNVMLRALEPVFEQLLARGISRDRAANLYEHMANRYAVNTTFRYTDNAMERSVFSELSENFLMFQRASEDFVKRFMRVVNANPAVLSRSFILMEAANHSGMVYPQTEVDDYGRRETHLVFTYPGSHLAARAFQEVGRALGWGDSLTLNPLYSSMTSQVRFLNPSLTNPMSMSTSPLIGMPLRIVRDLFPETDRAVTGILSTIEGGGESYFAEQPFLQSILPGPLNRLMPLLTPDALDGQLASSIRSAALHYWAAGLMPGEDASPDEIERANDTIREMAMNQLLWRAVTGAFLPAAPTYGEPEDLGLPEVSAISEALGNNTLRGEWFEVIRQINEEHGDSPEAYSYAVMEWLRRHPRGQSIVNPEAFTVGTSRAPGTAEESGSFNSGPTITQWMAENAGWIEENRAVAYYMLPGFRESNYSAAGWRQQLRNGQREHKTPEEFSNDVRYAIATREFYDKLDQRNALIASGTPRSTAYKDWNEWQERWRQMNPLSADMMDQRNSPAYIHNEVAPALQRVVESGNVPAGVDLEWATKVWNHYSEYHARYNETDTSGRNRWDRSKVNSEYRNTGDEMFSGTPAEDLWNAMNVYEVD